MKDWAPSMDEWERRLTEWNAAFQREYRREIRARRGLFRRPSAGGEEQAAAEARRLAGEETMVALFAFFDELCRDYLAAVLPQDDAKLRAWIGDRPALFDALWSYAEQAPELIRDAGDGERLELGLAAVSLDDGRVDLHQRDSVLGRLYLAARRAGIDPQPAFRKVAAHSNPGTGGGGAFTRQALEDFDRSYYFEQHVRQPLSRAG
jgi:hypothetical protein